MVAWLTKAKPFIKCLTKQETRFWFWRSLELIMLLVFNGTFERNSDIMLLIETA